LNVRAREGIGKEKKTLQAIQNKKKPGKRTPRGRGVGEKKSKGQNCRKEKKLVKEKSPRCRNRPKQERIPSKKETKKSQSINAERKKKGKQPLSKKNVHGAHIERKKNASEERGGSEVRKKTQRAA